MSNHLLFLHAVSPLHAGIGHTPGAIDLPIARDRATNFPLLPGSSIKGVLRAHAPADTKTRIYGPETTNASEHAGAVQVGDANLLVLPVRSICGTFAWVTSPYLLARFARDLKEVHGSSPALPSIPRVTSASQMFLGTENSALAEGGKVYLEDLDFAGAFDKDAGKWAELISARLFGDDHEWQQLFQKRFGVVSDDVMSFLSQHGMDVSTRIRLENDTKSVADGALWTEENLPVESILVSLVTLAPNTKTLDEKALRAAVVANNHGKTLQFGGNATVGRGRCRLVFASGGAK